MSAEGGEVEGSDDLLGIGDVYDDGGVGRGGDFFGIVEEHDEGAGHLGAVPDSPESGVAMYLEGFDEFVAVEQAVAKVLPKIRRSKIESVCGAGTLIGFFLDQGAVGVSEFNSDSDAEAVSDLAVVTGGVLGAVAEGALAGKLDGFSVGSKQFHGRNPGTGFGNGEVAAVFIEKLGGLFIAALAEEVGFADGLIGQGAVESKGGRGQQEGGREYREARSVGYGHCERAPLQTLDGKNGRAVSGRRCRKLLGLFGFSVFRFATVIKIWRE